MPLSMRKLVLSIVWICVSLSVVEAQVQKIRLANEYYNEGEYEKAADLYKEMYKIAPDNKSYFNMYIQCLLDMSEYATATEIISSEVKKNPDDVTLYVTLGNLYERQGMMDKAKNQFAKAINNLKADPQAISNLASTFINLAKYDLAIETYEKGEKESSVKNLYAYNLADLYRRQGDIPNMIKHYLIQADTERNTYHIQTSLSQFLPENQYEELQKQLYAKIQEGGNTQPYGELLQWSFLQKKEYGKALRQAKALDRQLEENGGRVFELGNSMMNVKDYNTAIEAFDYIITNHGKNTSFFFDSKRLILQAKKLKVVDNYNYTKDDLMSLKAEYKSFFEDIGRNTQTAEVLQEFADFEALYLNELDTAIIILEELRTFGGLQQDAIAKAKLSLGDYYLMSGDRWESSLLFSQVDKDFKEGVLGEQARYRNAKLSYYMGDFEWAQEQFKILKTATSKLISNDAIDMAVFILDNLGLDTTEQTMQMYATADLLAFQNKYDQAIAKLDSIPIIFPEHTLEDDVMYTKAHIFLKLKQTDKAIDMYNQIVEKFNEEIRADDSLYELAQLYDKDLKQPEKAMPLYEKIFLDYSSSTYAVDARNRFRELKGDSVQ
jgi:tetratricopeptide (TPR) repeat protein